MKYSKALKMFSVGDTVCIKDNGLRSTDDSFTATDDMRDMVGEHHEITRISRSDRHGIACVRLAGFSWSADDLYVTKHVNDGKLVNDMGQTDVLMFDPQTL